jgi:hypothetical protein
MTAQNFCGGNGDHSTQRSSFNSHAYQSSFLGGNCFSETQLRRDYMNAHSGECKNAKLHLNGNPCCSENVTLKVRFRLAALQGDLLSLRYLLEAKPPYGGKARYES